MYCKKSILNYLKYFGLELLISESSFALKLLYGKTNLSFCYECLRRAIKKGKMSPSLFFSGAVQFENRLDG